MLRFGRKRAKPSVITLADRARDEGQWELAAGYYRAALNRNPQRPPIWVQYGHVLKESGQLPEAERAYQTAIAYDSHSADSYLQLGHLLKMRGKKEWARAAYVRAFALDPFLDGTSFEFAQLGWSKAHFSELQSMLGTEVNDPVALAKANGTLPEHLVTQTADGKLAGWEREDPAFGLASNVIADTYIRKRLVDARSWYRKFGRKVVILIPSYRDMQVLSNCIGALRRTTTELMVDIIITDDFSQDERHISFLQSLPREHDNIRVIFGEKNIGFAGNVNRGLTCCIDQDVILMNSDVEPIEGWLEILQHSVYLNDAAIGAPRLLYPNGTIQFGGGMRNFGAPLWFDHFFRSQLAEFVPAIPDVYMLYATGAVMYVRRETLCKLGGLDPKFPMAYEDVDLCLRAWKRGLRTIYIGAACAIHHESITRGRDLDERQVRSQEYFWQKHQAFFARSLRHKTTGLPHVIFVCQDVGVGGGHRVIYTHANYLAGHGFTVELWNLAGSPDWFTLDPNIRVQVFGSYYDLTQALSRENAIKIATWWETAEPVWLGSVLTGIPVYFVQDIESSYYKGLDDAMAARVLSWYRSEFNYATTTEWITRELESRFRVNAIRVGLGYQSSHFRRLDGVERRERTILVAARGERLKNFTYAKQILMGLRELGIKVVAFGSEGTSLIQDFGNIEFHAQPTDDELCRLYNQAQFFIQTSIHEGFSLPPIEAMACGCIPILTAAQGNKEYIEDSVNCIVIPLGNVRAATDKILRILNSSDEVIQRLSDQGLETARQYNWEEPTQRMQKFLNAIVARPEYGLQVRELDLM